MTSARRQRVWTVADFARHAYDDDSPQACRRARRFLKKLDAKHGGTLLIPSAGTNREFTFYPATLARLEEDLFSPIESIEFRLDAVEEAAADANMLARKTALQCGENTRAIAHLRASSTTTFRKNGDRRRQASTTKTPS